MSDAERYVPLSVRMGRRDAAEFGYLQDGVPGHLMPSLSEWLAKPWNEFQLQGPIQRTLQIDMAGVRESVYSVIVSDGDLMLDAVDYALSVMHSAAVSGAVDLRAKEYLAGQVAALQTILSQASSAYTVIATGDTWHLERRVDKTAKAAFEDAREQTRNSSDLLQDAWTATFKREPDADKAFRASVLAVESVTCALLAPNDSKPTLGKAISHLRATVANWTVAGLDDQQRASGETLLAVLETVWQNHQRHVKQGGVPPDQTGQDEAEAVLFLAVTIVQWFERGFVRKRK